MSTNLTTAEQLSSLASAIKGKLNVLDTLPATVNGGLWFEGGGSVPIIKMFYGGDVFKITPELILAPVTPVTPDPPANDYVFVVENLTFTIFGQNTETTNSISNELSNADDVISGLATICEPLSDELQQFAASFTMLACRSVLFSGTVPDYPPELRFSPTDIYSDGMIVFVFLLDEEPDAYQIIEGQIYENQCIATPGIEIVTALLDQPTTMIVLQPQE